MQNPDYCSHPNRKLPALYWGFFCYRRLRHALCFYFILFIYIFILISWDLGYSISDKIFLSLLRILESAEIFMQALFFVAEELCRFCFGIYFPKTKDFLPLWGTTWGRVWLKCWIWQQSLVLDAWRALYFLVPDMEFPIRKISPFRLLIYSIRRYSCIFVLLSPFPKSSPSCSLWLFIQVEAN